MLSDRVKSKILSCYNIQLIIIRSFRSIKSVLPVTLMEYTMEEKRFPVEAQPLHTVGFLNFQSPQREIRINLIVSDQDTEEIQVWIIGSPWFLYHGGEPDLTVIEAIALSFK